MIYYSVKLEHGELYISLKGGQTEIISKNGGSQSSCSVVTGDWLETPKAIRTTEDIVVIKIVSLKGVYRADIVGGSLRIYMGTAPEGESLELTQLDVLPSPIPFPFEDR